MDWDVVVVGAGAAGLVAAERAAARGKKTLLLERNRKPGVKILISGGTRCNLTHATDRRGIVAAYGPPGRFLHSALAALGPDELVALVEAEGVPTKIEETGKIFPVSDRATDVLAAFLARLQRSNCELAAEESLVELDRADSSTGIMEGTEPGFRLVTSRRTLTAQAVVITTGGQSYPKSGTTGDGYRFAAKFGHTIVQPRPALTPITTSSPWVRSLSGITIPEVELRLYETANSQKQTSDCAAHSNAKRKPLDVRVGSLLFAHFGLSGPVALDLSRHISGHAQPQALTLECDLLPSIKQSELDEQLHHQAMSAGKKHLLALVPEIIPRRLAEIILAEAGLQPEAKAGELSKLDRAGLVRAIKQLPIAVAGTKGFDKAEVTAGGVNLDEVDSRTMQSKLVRNLFLAGEVLDLDGPIGGYNFQAAFSTGWLAGINV
jgi:predicted Rossmann fold flavoprotein